MTWTDTFELDQPALFSVPEADNSAPHIPVCGQLAPEGKPCGKWLGWGKKGSSETFCRQAEGHPGMHVNMPSRCNRPARHEGEHMVLHSKDYAVLARWR